MSRVERAARRRCVAGAGVHGHVGVAVMDEDVVRMYLEEEMSVAQIVARYRVFRPVVDKALARAGVRTRATAQATATATARRSGKAWGGKGTFRFVGGAW